MFQYTGAQFDKSLAMSRATARKVDLNHKNQKRKFEAGSPASKRGLTIDERQTGIAPRLKALTENREEISTEIESRVVDLASLRQHQGNFV